MRYAITQLAAFVDRPGYLWRAVASELAREGEGAKQIKHAGFILALLRIDL
jgi:hypothetical protein